MENGAEGGNLSLPGFSKERPPWPVKKSDKAQAWETSDAVAAPTHLWAPLAHALSLPYLLGDHRMVSG